MFGHLSQHSLARSHLQLEDRTLDGAALFPFFDQTGRTRAVMLLERHTRRIVLVDWTPGIFEHRWLRRDRVRLRYTDMRDAAASDAEGLADFWHFDPWWLLGEDRYAGHEAVPALRRTNVPGYDESVQRAWFAPGLHRLSYLLTGTGDSRKLRRAGPDVFTVMARRRRDAHAPAPAIASDPYRAEWRLRPFWSRPRRPPVSSTT